MYEKADKKYTRKLFNFREISGSQGGECKDDSLLG
jgi:hypothetical protein